MTDQGYSQLKQAILIYAGINLEFYKEQQVKRRLDGYLLRVKASSIDEYCGLLRRDREAAKDLRNFLTINVAEFFRDPSSWDQLKTTILPNLFRQRSDPKIWSAGCSNGPEAYSLAMLLAEHAPHSGFKILASDLDDLVLRRAKAGGPYGPGLVANVPKWLLAKYFTDTQEGWTVSETLRRRVDFKMIDLLRPPVQRGFDLIVCRNVVIYFSEGAKTDLYRRFVESLSDGGWLFIGGTETLMDAPRLGLQRKYPGFYQKIASRWSERRRRTPLPSFQNASRSASSRRRWWSPSTHRPSMMSSWFGSTTSSMPT